MIIPVYSQESKKNDFEYALQGMVEDLEKKLVHIAETVTNYGDRYYVLVMARQDPPGSGMIKQMVYLWPVEPPKFLATMVFCVDRKRGEISRLWAIPGDWSQYPTKHLAESTPEIIASKNELGHFYRHSKV